MLKRFPFQLITVGVAVTAASLTMLPVGCSQKTEESRIFGDKLKVSYLGLTCEVPIFVAYEKGFFKEQGLDVELVKTDWDSLREGLGLGRFDATHHLTMFLLKPIEMGMDIVLTGGVHSGCLRLQAGVKTDIQKLEDFKGKKVAISSMGNPPLMFSSRALSRGGMDTQRDIEWVVYPNEAMELALEQGLIQGVASAEPIGTILISRNKVRSICDQATDPPFDKEYCCVTVVNGELARQNPDKAARATKAMLKGALWVQNNQTAAAKMAVEKKYTSATPEINAQAISVLNYHPGVAKAKHDLLAAAIDMKAFGYLRADTDPKALVEKAWLELPGVTDEWVKGLTVEKVTDGGRPRRMSPAQFAAFFDDPRICREFKFCPDDCSW